MLDPAALRRVRHKVLFGMPDAGTRTRIWRCHVPDRAPLSPDVDFDRLARELEWAGGQIANAGLSAASLAASRLEEGSAEGQIAMADFQAAAKPEARGREVPAKSGRLGFQPAARVQKVTSALDFGRSRRILLQMESESRPPLTGT